MILKSNKNIVNDKGSLVYLENFNKCIDRLKNVETRLSEISSNINKTIGISNSNSVSVVMDVQDINLEIIKLKNIIKEFESQGKSPF